MKNHTCVTFAINVLLRAIHWKLIDWYILEISQSSRYVRLLSLIPFNPIYIICNYIQCEFCPTTCGRKTDLRIHVQKLHTSDKMLTCKRCDQSFPDRYQFKLHLKTHEGQNCYKCDLCNYASVSARHLESHMLIHTDQKPVNILKTIFHYIVLNDQNVLCFTFSLSAMYVTFHSEKSNF